MFTIEEIKEMRRKIKYLKKHRCIAYKYFSDKIGVHQGDFSKFLTAEKDMSRARLLKLKEILEEF